MYRTSPHPDPLLVIDKISRGGETRDAPFRSRSRYAAPTAEAAVDCGALHAHRRRRGRGATACPVVGRQRLADVQPRLRPARRFSPLADINADNAAQLTQAWSVQLTQPAGRRGGGRRRRGAPPQGRRARRRWRGAAALRLPTKKATRLAAIPQVTPIVVNGVMYLPARGNQVLALDADTARRSGATRCRRPSRPPRAAWPTGRAKGASAPRILLTAGPRLLALDAADRPARGGIRPRRHSIEITVPWNGVPMIYKHVAILGTYPGEVPLGPTGRHARVRRAHRQEAVAVPERAAARAGRARDVARLRLARSVGHERLGVLHDARRRARHPLHAGRRRRPRTTGAAIAPARTSSPTRSWPSMPRPGSTAGTSRRCITTSGTSTCRRRRCSSTSRRTAGACRRSPRSASPATCSSSIASPASRSSASRSVPCPKGEVPDEWYSPTQPFPVKPARSFGRVEFDKERDMVRAEDTIGRSTPPNVRRCGTRAADSTTPVRLRRSCSTRTARRRGAACSSPARAAA